MIGLGVGINRQRFAQGSSFFAAYAARVAANGGVTEAGSCVNSVSGISLNSSLLLIPSGYKSGVAYSELPTNGNGDLTWSRNSVANRTLANGDIGSVAANVPRLSYMYGSCPALLLEPQRTNSLRNSTMQGASTSPSTLPTNWASSAGGLTQSVVGVGTENGLPYVDIQFSGTATATTSDIRVEASTQIAASNGQTWSESIYIKLIAAPTPPNSYQIGIFERTSGGGAIVAGNVTITPTSSLQRFTFTRTLSGGVTVAFVQPYFANILTIGNTYDFTIRIAAPQMELGAFATTWINTTNAAATRLVDTFSRNNIYTNGLISASGGTWYVELKNNVAYIRDAYIEAIMLRDSTTSNYFVFTFGSSGTIASRALIRKYTSATLTTIFTTTTDTVKLAIKWNGTTADIFANGTKVVSATAFTATALEVLSSSGADAPKFIQAMALFPTPLSDSDCQTLTT